MTAAREKMSAALFAAGAQGIQETDGLLIAHFFPGTNKQAIRTAIATVDPDARAVLAEYPDIDWQCQRAHVTAHTIGALTVTPPWLSTNAKSQFEVVVDPAMAFGTGEHATTRGCLLLLQQAEPRGKRVADLGTGSAVLAIAAAKLGAKCVIGIEIDADAVPNAEANVEANGVADRVTIIEGNVRTLLPLAAPFDLILANILSSTIRELFASMSDSLSSSGTAILSGILDEESEGMKEFLARLGWITRSEHVEEGWWTALVARR